MTGVASGIGAATAAQLRREGCRVIGVDLLGADIVADLAGDEGRLHMVGEAARRCDGALDIVVACAGVLNRGATTLAVNYFGAVATLLGLRHLLAASDAPRAVAVGSVAAYFPSNADLVARLLAGDEAEALGSIGNEPEIGLYAASKLALARWCRSAAIDTDWAGAGILLNVVAPGLVETA
ncbi:MAG: NAD-dependent epimerase/dehydratase family protein [Rhodospirillales bacterium]